MKSRIVAALMALLFCAAASAELVELDRIAAFVNDDVIMYSELKARVQLAEYDARQRGETQLPPRNIMERQILDAMVMEMIQTQLADRNGIRVDDQSLNQTMTRIAQDNGLSLDGFRRALEADGLSYAEASSRVRREMLISRVRQRMVMDRIQVSPQEVANFLRSEAGKSQTAAEYNLAHLLVPLPEDPSPSAVNRAKQQATSIYNDLRAGGDFDEIAGRYAAKGSNLRGGELGWRKTTELPTIFADAIPDLNNGEVAEPIASPSGFHVIKLLGTRGGDVNFVKETRARHILIRPSEIRSDEEAKALARDLRRRIRAGEDFADIARAYSDDPNSARNGGELDWVGPGATAPEFEKVMENIVVNEISQPFRTQFGWHVLQVLERRDTDKSDEFRNRQAQNVLRQRKFQESISDWLAEIREEAYVDTKI